jgi:hypothetical protein
VIIEDRTIYLHQTVRTEGEKLYERFDLSDAWRVMLQATNDQKIVEMIVKSRSADEARRALRELADAEKRKHQSRRGNDDRATRANSSIEITTIPGR